MSDKKLSINILDPKVINNHHEFLDILKNTLGVNKYLQYELAKKIMWSSDGHRGNITAVEFEPFSDTELKELVSLLQNNSAFTNPRDAEGGMMLDYNTNQ